MSGRFGAILLLALVAAHMAQAFMPSSGLPMSLSNRAAARGCGALKMTSENENSADESLTKRRAVIGALFGAMIAAPTLVPDAADAATRSGGRVGGGFRKTSSARTSMGATAAPPAAAPAAPVSRTVIINNSPAPVYGGYGGMYGGGFYGGVSYGPMLSPGAWVGLTALELAETYAREQRRQEAMKRELETQRKLGQDQAAIEALQKQVEAQNKMMMEMSAKMGNK